MAESGRDQIEDGEDFDAAPHAGSQIGRSALWGCVALAAMAGAIYAGRSEAGIRRIATAWSLPDATVVSIPQAGFASAFDVSLARETRRLAATVESMTSERQTLLARLDNLERSTEATGSVPSPDRSAKAAAMPAAPAAMPPADVSPPPSNPTQANPPAALASAGSASRADIALVEPPPSSARAAAESPGPVRTADPAGPLEEIFNSPVKVSAGGTTQDGGEPSVYRTDFGIDVGGAPTLEALRGLWLTLKVRHAGLFDGLRPIVSVREGSAGVELRLVAGPLSNASAAARLCVALPDTRCKAVVFDGQRLAMH